MKDTTGNIELFPYGTPTSVEGFKSTDSAQRFDGMSNFFTLNKIGNMEYNEFTLSIWVRFADVATSPACSFISYSYDGAYGWDFGFNGINVYFSATKGDMPIIINSIIDVKTLDFFNFHNFAITFKSLNYESSSYKWDIRMFVDGVLDNTYSDTNASFCPINYNSDAVLNPSRLCIGSLANKTKFFTGDITKIIYNPYVKSRCEQLKSYKSIYIAREVHVDPTSEGDLLCVRPVGEYWDIPIENITETVDIDLTTPFTPSESNTNGNTLYNSTFYSYYSTTMTPPNFSPIIDLTEGCKITLPEGEYTSVSGEPGITLGGWVNYRQYLPYSYHSKSSHYFQYLVSMDLRGITYNESSCEKIRVELMSYQASRFILYSNRTSKSYDSRWYGNHFLDRYFMHSSFKEYGGGFTTCSSAEGAPTFPDGRDPTVMRFRIRMDIKQTNNTAGVGSITLTQPVYLHVKQIKVIFVNSPSEFDYILWKDDAYMRLCGM